MKRCYNKRKDVVVDEVAVQVNVDDVDSPQIVEGLEEIEEDISNPTPKRACLAIERDITSTDQVPNCPTDLGLRPCIWSYKASVRDECRRIYASRGPCQLIHHNFTVTEIGGKPQKFCSGWFKNLSLWLEYSVNKDTLFCLYCYIFKPRSEVGSSQGGGDSFTEKGFKYWNKNDRLATHEGKHDRAYNKARGNFDELKKQEDKVVSLFTRRTIKDKVEYRVFLTTAIDCVRYLLRQGLSFRGHEESNNSMKQGNYLDLFHFLAHHNEEVNKVSFVNASEKLEMTLPTVQKDICRAKTEEILEATVKDIDDSYFSILVDESRDISTKEQMSVVLRYVNKNGLVIERYLGIQHVTSTTVISLKATVDDLFARYNLSISKIRRQGYDGANNMKGDSLSLKN